MKALYACLLVAVFAILAVPSANAQVVVAVGNGHHHRHHRHHHHHRHYRR